MSDTTSEEGAASGSPTSSHARARRLVQRFTALAVAPALVPIPLVDVALIGAVQLRLVQRLAQTYGADFTPERARSLIGALVGGGVSAMTGVTAARALPSVGWVVGMATIGATGAASTWAVGQLFTQHFASGGTLLSFDPEKVRAHYARLLRQAPTKTSDGTAQAPRKP